MAEAAPCVLLDQNVSVLLVEWLASRLPSWRVLHTSDVGLQGASDEAVMEWAKAAEALVITFDEDLADQRLFPLGTHSGVVRLRVWPTTLEETQAALARLLDEVGDLRELRGALVVLVPFQVRRRGEKLLVVAKREQRWERLG